MNAPAHDPLGATDLASAPPLVIAHKFGGSSVASAERYQLVAALLRAQPETHQVTVVSAMRGVTDALIELADTALAGRPWRDRWEALREKHLTTVQSIGGPDGDQTYTWLVAQFEDLAALLSAIALLGPSGESALALVHGLGEVWSAGILRAALTAQDTNAAVLDARDVLVVGHNEIGVAVDWNASASRLGVWREANPQSRVVVTGFVAREARGAPTTLGRNGSDFSGAIFAVLFNASELHIWTDVDGVLSADPRAVPDAILLPHLSYDEACELAYFGAKVLHPQTLAPAIAHRLPIRIRNTFNPAHPGTQIDAQGDTAAPRSAKGLSLVSDLALINVEGSGMIGVPGTAERVFGTLRANDVSVIMISQGSSEHSICCVVQAAQAEAGRAALARAFASEIAQGQIQNVGMERGVSVLAAVGDGMVGTPGVAARFFHALARVGINVRAIAQGASERNISVVISASDATKALRAAHAGFWLSPQTVSVGVVGCGKVGAALLDQIAAAAPRLARTANLDLRLRAIADSRRMHLADDAKIATPWRERLSDSIAYNLDAFAAHVHATHLPHAVIIDCTAQPEVAERYADWLTAGIHVITPNKQAGAGPLPQWRAVQAAAANSGARFRYEATVCAGLPVISTLRDLLDTGDTLIAIEGILSGTLAWLFNRYDGTQPFSSLVHEARRLGYTEPDARDDLSGADVARKLVILAREAGRELNLAGVQVESLIPRELIDVAPGEFLARLGEFDEVMRERHARARSTGNVLRYVARLDASGARVGLVEVPVAHAFAHLQLTDNVVQFTTRRYCDNPLIVQGPGAGPEVTAAGVFADLLRLGAALGARL